MAGLKRRVEQGIVKGCSTVEPEKSLFGKYSDAEMLVQLRRIALDPCDPEVTPKNVRSLFSQTLRVREVLSLSQTDCPRRMVVPVGPRFQAEVPEWTVPFGNVKADSADGDSDDSRWLGTRVWPNEIDDTKLSTRSIGKGREESCTCQTPGSVDCVRRHVLEERLLLQCDIGPAFATWKFDQMGEQMMKSWTVKEQQIFQPLVKIKLETNGKNFLKHALKSIPSKYRTTVINFYFNVFLPGRIGLQTRMSSEVQVDTDDDEAGDSNYLHVPNRSHGKTGMPVKSNDVKKTRYLRVRT
ncbi:PREDICTED: AT-rich interactive domain-containing protein 2-like isoform X2 [Ipomoea nil]|uniref:AT-rich interactive domain-containing protein 2-like isoform X2 n=1 Tax=Ipomoea nil TaxID=35883 RepID=UPI000900F133|nr:PREDICTED: AT-rich interactive domain-containing protein 2-like isoform X2 [Ipomoea nil]